MANVAHRVADEVVRQARPTLNNAPAVWSSTKLLEFDYCVAPSTKILRSDLVWVNADQLQVGEELIGFDETLGVGHKHSFRPSTVLSVRRVVLPRVKVSTTHGETIVAANHKFAARYLSYRRRWIAARQLKPGARMAFLTAPWEPEQTWEAGWLAGFLDGEGWLSQTSLGYGQNPGPTLAMAQRLLAARGFNFYGGSSPNTTNAQFQIAQGIRDTLRLLGMIRPQRLFRKQRNVWENRRTWGKKTPVVTVIDVEALPDDVCIAIETSTKTYISDGFFSHNCAIEAMVQGWCMRSRAHVRMARLGVHGFLASAILGQPLDPDAPDADLAPILKGIKKSKDPHVSKTYDGSKRTVHAVSYGQTAMGTYLSNPTLFPTLAAAEATRARYFALTPSLPDFQQAVQWTAYERGYLGGAEDYQYIPPSMSEGKRRPGRVIGHPYKYQLWLFSVVNYQRLSLSQKLWREKRKMPVEQINGIWYGIQLGEDAKRACAYYGQSIARGILTEAALPLFSLEEPLSDRCYVGDLYYGETPLRAPIHDSLLFECPTRKVDRLIERVAYAMQRPVEALPVPPEWQMGTHLAIGVDAKIGDDWGHMEGIELPTWQEIGVAADLPVSPTMDEDVDEDETDEALETELRVSA